MPLDDYAYAHWLDAAAPWPSGPPGEEDGFLHVLRGCPADDTTRLVYADWLEDRGDQRAEYLRALCQPSRYRSQLVALRNQVPLSWATLVGTGVLVGSRQRFAIRIGEQFTSDDGPRAIDFWAGGRWLTCDDNSSYVYLVRRPAVALYGELASGGRSDSPFPDLAPAEAFRRIHNEDDLRREYSIFDCGPITDNVDMLLFRSGDRVRIHFEFLRPNHYLPADRGKVQVAELPTEEMLGVLCTALEILAGNAP